MSRVARGVLALVFGLGSSCALAATYFVDAAAANDSGKGTASSPKKHISSGLRLLSRAGGDTLVIRSGRYDHPQDAIVRSTANFNGVPAKPHTIRAESDGGVTVLAALDLPLSSAHLVFEGIKWDGDTPKGIAGKDLKLIRCAFKGGARKGNNATLTIGTNDQMPGASRVLLEDSWVYGEGGRYRLLVYNAEQVVLRRVVVRHDGGWEYDGRNPQGGISIYNTQHVELQNVLLIDNDLELPGWEAALYIVRNIGNRIFDRHIGTRVRGSVILNTRRRAVGIEGFARVEDVFFENLLVWKSGQGLSLNGEAHEAKIKNSTFGRIKGPAFAIWGRHPSRLKIDSSLIHDAERTFQVDAGTIEGEFNACSQAPKCSTPHSISVGALNSGLIYPPRIELGSRLHSAGPGGSPVGAMIEKTIGAQGSLHGEAGFDSVGNESLWPWPFEARLKRDLCEDLPSRGLCSSHSTLTEYVWGQLGRLPKFAVGGS